MKFSYNWVQSFLDKKLPTPEKLSDILTMKLFEVEETEQKKDDWTIDVDILPNRAGDCLSHAGIAREISAIIGSKFKEPDINLKEDEENDIGDIISIKVLSADDCPRYFAKAVTGIKVGPSPGWIKEKLEICGLQSINNIVDIANYIMLETGQPLHAFDMDKISGKVTVRRAEEKEKIITLDGKEYSLGNEILMIADDDKLLGIAGIKGGKNAEISNQTKNIFIESASFNRKVIRKGSAKLKLRTDASMRFEHGFDSNINEAAANRAATLIKEIAGGKILRGAIDFYPKKNLPKKISLDLERTEKILGVRIEEMKTKEILKTLGFEIGERKGKIIEVKVPTRRTDVSLEEDLMEEIGRIMGYEKTPSKLPRMEVIPPKRNIGLFWEDKIKSIFKAAGFSEIYNYTFISQEQSNDFCHSEKQLIEVESPVSVEQKYLRPSLMPHIFRNVKENEKFFKDIKIFELGKVFSKESGFSEFKSLAGAMTGDSFYQLKGILDLVFKEFGIKGVEYSRWTDNEMSFLDLSKKALIAANLENMGYLGSVSSRVMKEMKIDLEFSVFELNFDKIIKMASEEKKYSPIARFPETTRDLSILTPLETSFKEVLNGIKDCAPDFLEDVQLFDVYQGKGIPEKNKSLTLRLTYRGDRTLTAEEVNIFQDEIIKGIEKNKGWQIRK